MNRLSRVLPAVVVLLGAAWAQAQLAAGASSSSALADPASAAASQRAAASVPAPSSASSLAARSASAPSSPPPPSLCTESVPKGKARPRVKETFPERGLVGHEARLKLIIEHGKGETVLPDGFQFQLAGDQLSTLEQSGFMLPDPEGEAAPTIERVPNDGGATTTVVVKFVPISKKPGRHELELPPLPIAIARASGDVMTVCTRPHTITVDEPIANAADPKPQPNPPPQRQREEWTWLKNLTYASLVALLVGAVLGWLLVRWLRRPRPTRPPPPPRPPWEVAIEELHDIRHAGLIDAERYAEHYDRVSYTVRKYLGERYGFDGLESTTREILHVLRGVVPPVPPLDEIDPFLKEADLVKFAKLTPTPEQCRVVLERGDSIVRRTVPHLEADSTTSPSPQADSGEGAVVAEADSPHQEAP